MWLLTDFRSNDCSFNSFLTAAGKYQLHSMASLVTASVHACSHCCGKISVTLSGFSCYCFGTCMFSLLRENISYTQWLLLLLLRYMHVLTAAGKYQLHSVASLVTASVHACSHCCGKISVTLSGFSCYCFGTCMFSLLRENISYTQWLLLLLLWHMHVLTAAGKYQLHSVASLVTASAHASAMSTLQKEMCPSLYGWDTPLLPVTTGNTDTVGHLLLLDITTGNTDTV